MRWLAQIAIVGAVFCGSGCPREVQVPDPEDDAQTCEDRSDCNDRSCGELRACVDGLCQQDAALIVPCLDGGG